MKSYCERRRHDRRETEGVLRNGAERRRVAERRCPELLEISFREWVTCKVRILRAESAVASLQRLDVAMTKRLQSAARVPQARRATERRCAEGGAPSGWGERRRSPERRLPEVRELALADFLIET